MPTTTRPQYRNVHGLAFAPTKKMRRFYEDQGLTIFIGKENWESAGAPENAILYDFIDALLTMQVPVLDTIHTDVGLFLRRTPLLTPEPYAAIRLFPNLVANTGSMSLLNPKDPELVSAPNKVVLIQEEINVQRTKSSLSRGVATRVVKK